MPLESSRPYQGPKAVPFHVLAYRLAIHSSIIELKFELCLDIGYAVAHYKAL